MTLGTIFLVIGAFSALMSAVGYRWQRDAVALADDRTNDLRERIDARISSVTLGIQTAAFVATTIVCCILAFLLLTGTIRGAS